MPSAQTRLNTPIYLYFCFSAHWRTINCRIMFILDYSSDNECIRWSARFWELKIYAWSKNSKIRFMARVTRRLLFVKNSIIGVCKIWPQANNFRSDEMDMGTQQSDQTVKIDSTYCAVIIYQNVHLSNTFLLNKDEA